MHFYAVLKLCECSCFSFCYCCCYETSAVSPFQVLWRTKIYYKFILKNHEFFRSIFFFFIFTDQINKRKKKNRSEKVFKEISKKNRLN